MGRLERQVSAEREEWDDEPLVAMYFICTITIINIRVHCME